MDTRALGKALGRRLRCASRRHRSPVLTTFTLTLWTMCAGVASEPDPGASPLPAFHEIEQVTVKKQRFFDYLTPVIRAENDRIRRHRSQLAEIASAWKAGEGLGWLEVRYLGWLAEEYRVNADMSSRSEVIDELLKRVDVIPRSLVLVQAAKESGWGCSRFARGANNLFGQWCYERGCGMVPRQRPGGMTHEVRSFDSVRDSVASYMRNLNSHASYHELRELRAELRRTSRPLSGMLLAEGLTQYAARGAAYVHEVQTMIRRNGLESAELVSAVAGD